MRMVLLFLFSLCAIASSHPQASASGVCPEPTMNIAVAFFRDSDVQFETMQQRRAIASGLSDLLELPDEQILSKNYPDFQMQRNKWDLFELLSHYFVSKDASKLRYDRELQRRLSKEARCPDGREAVNNRLRTLPVIE